MRPDYARFSALVEQLAKECNLEVKNEGGQTLYATYGRDGYLGEYLCVYVRPYTLKVTTQETQ